MAKHIAAFNVSAFIDSAIQTMNKGGDTDKAIKAAAPAIKGRTLSDCVDAFCVGADLKRGIDASQQAAANEARTIMSKGDIDVESKSAVLNALRPIFWAKRGYAEPLKQSKETPLQGKQALDYQNASADISRMGKLVMGKTATQKLAPKVPRAAQKAINELLAQFDANVLREAIKLGAK